MNMGASLSNCIRSNAAARKESKIPGAPISRHGPGLKLSQAKLPPSFQRVPPVSLCENERLTATRNLGPAPPIVQSPVYTGSSSVDESLMSEAEKQLQELLARQLDTSESSLANALGHVREYTPAVVFQPLANEMRGLHTLSQYISKEQELGKLDQLRQMGLTEQEIEMKMKEDGQSYLQPSSAKKSKLGAEPRAQEERLEVLHKKISEREKLIQEPTKYTGVKTMSRHAMEVERSLFRGSAVSNSLVHLTQEDEDRHSHMVAYPKSIMPSSTVVKNTEKNESHPNIVIPLPAQIIERNRFTEAEIRALPRFKSYTPGFPNKVLYIKNLDSKVSADDLQAVFQGGVHATSAPHIRLMTGRMKGQAFIEFESIESATEALKLINGYLIRGKPMVISYGHATRKPQECTPADCIVTS